MPTISVARSAKASSKASSTLSPTDQARPRFATEWLWPTTAVVSVHGELDASNAAELTEYGLQRSRPGGQLVLDLSAVRFFGASCFACLHTLNVQCVGDNVDWAVVTSPAVARVVRICDPAGALPVSPTLPGALAALRNQPPDLQLVTRSS